MEGLLEDLRSGNWPAAMPKLQRAIRATVRLRRIPAPRGAARWSTEDLAELVQEFVADKSGPGRLVQIALAAEDEAHCQRLLDTSVKNFIADRTRTNPRTKLRRTVRALCGPGAGFDLTDEVIRATGSAAAVYAGDDATLAAAAHRTPVAPPPWREGSREGPPTDRVSFIALCTAVLEAAGGAVRLDTMVSVLAERLRIRAAWDDGLDDAPDPVQSVTDRSAVASADDYTVATVIWDGLDDEERMLVTFVGTGGRTASAESGVALGKSAAQKRLERLEPKLREALSGCSNPDGVVAALFAIHAEWMSAGGGRSADVVRSSNQQGGDAPHRATRSLYS